MEQKETPVADIDVTRMKHAARDAMRVLRDFYAAKKLSPADEVGAVLITAASLVIVATFGLNDDTDPDELFQHVRAIYDEFRAQAPKVPR